MRGAWVVLAALGVAACGNGPNKAQRAEYEENARHYTPPSVMSRLDFGGIVERRFRRLDHNGDDFIDQSELPTPNDPSIMSLDKNGDGKVSEQEFTSGMMARFDGHDINHDGTVTSDEFRATKRK